MNWGKWNSVPRSLCSFFHGDTHVFTLLRYADNSRACKSVGILETGRNHFIIQIFSLTLGFLVCGPTLILFYLFICGSWCFGFTFESGSHYVAQKSLKLLILPQFLQCSDCRHMTPSLATTLCHLQSSWLHDVAWGTWRTGTLEILVTSVKPPASLIPICLPTLPNAKHTWMRRLGNAPCTSIIWSYCWDHYPSVFWICYSNYSTASFKFTQGCLLRLSYTSCRFTATAIYVFVSHALVYYFPGNWLQPHLLLVITQYDLPSLPNPC